jgi:sugar lactone lactonase YvrE
VRDPYLYAPHARCGRSVLTRSSSRLQLFGITLLISTTACSGSDPDPYPDAAQTPIRAEDASITVDTRPRIDASSVDSARHDSAVDAALDALSDADAGADAGTGADAGLDAGTGADALVDASTSDSSQPAELGPGVATLAGAADPGDADGFRTTARFRNPVNVVVDSDGALYVAEYDATRVRRVTPAGEVTTIGAGAKFGGTFGLVRVGADLLFQNDQNSASTGETGSLWRIDSAGGDPELLLDDAGRWRGMAALPDGRLVVADSLGHVIQLVDLESKTVTLLAGERNEPAWADGAGALARFEVPYDIVLVSPTEFIVSDLGNNLLRKVTLAGEVTTFAGDGEAATTDGALSEAQFNGPKALAVDAAGNIYVTEAGGHVIRKVSVAGQVTTIAGSGAAGFNDAENPLEAQFFGMEGIDVTPDGRFLYIADGTEGQDAAPYHRLRRLQLR